jgi:hypothetical protein
MKKYILTIFIIFVLCFSYSCKNSKLLECNKTKEESNTGAITNSQFHVGDVPRWTTKIINTNPEKEKTIVFEQSERKLTYDRTIEQGYSIYSIDYYSEKDTGYAFKFNNETGEYIGYSKSQKCGDKIHYFNW